MLQHASFTPEAISERNTEKDKALRSYFYVFLLFSLQGIRPKNKPPTNIQDSGVRTFCRPTPSRGSSCIHSCVCQTCYILCANTVSCHTASSYLAVRRCRQKCKRNSPPVGFFPCFLAQHSTHLKTFNFICTQGVLH